jgi:hypothetical protein
MNQCAIRRKSLYRLSIKEYDPLFVRMMRSNQLYLFLVFHNNFIFLLINHLIKYKNIKRKKDKLYSIFFIKLTS